MSTFLSWVLGCITTIVVALWVENLRRPRLRLSLPPPHDVSYTDRPARSARYLGIGVSNEPACPPHEATERCTAVPGAAHVSSAGRNRRTWATPDGQVVCFTRAGPDSGSSRGRSQDPHS